jgi:hypothetical protein
LVELDVRAGARRRASDQAGSAGNVVLEGKLAVLAARAEQVRDEAVDRAPEAAIARLRAHLAGQGSES